METRIDPSFLDDALSFASGQVRHHVADALACHLHNDGYALEGNTEGNDVEWFARTIWEAETGRTGWDVVSDDVKTRYRRVARAVIAALPRFQERVARRLITLSKVVREIERGLRQPRR